MAEAATKQKTIIPVSGKWDWVSKDKPNGQEITFPVACWEMDNETGHVTALIAIDANHGGDKNDPTESVVTRLVAPPPIPGRYVRVD